MLRHARTVATADRVVAQLGTINALGRSTAIPVPDLRRIVSVPARHLAGLEQIENGGRVGATVMARFILEGLAVIAALWMRCEIQMFNNLVCG